MSRAFVWYRRPSFDGTCSPAGSGRIVNIGSRAGKGRVAKLLALLCIEVRAGGIDGSVGGRSQR